MARRQILFKVTLGTEARMKPSAAAVSIPAASTKINKPRGRIGWFFNFDDDSLRRTGNAGWDSEFPEHAPRLRNGSSRLLV
jgi:hypothetical protein